MDISFFKNAIRSRGFSLFEKKKSVVGVDIGSSSVKVVQLRLEEERGILETYGELATGPYAGQGVGQATRLPDAKASELIHDVISETNVSAKEAIVSIPLRNSFVVLIEMPDMSDKELKEAMQYEARRYVPVPIGDVITDWWRLPERKHTEVATPSLEAKKSPRRAHQTKVLLVAVPKDLIEKYRRILMGGGLEPSAFEIETFGGARAIIGHERSEVLIIDIGALTTKMTIMDEGIVRGSHSVERGAQAISLALAQSLGVDFERAEAAKRDVGISLRPEYEGMRKIITPLVDSILMEIERFATEYARRYNTSLAKIYVTGGGASLPGLVDYMVKKFGVEVMVANPFSKVEYPAFFQPVLKEIGPSFSIAVGLALRGLK